MRLALILVLFLIGTSCNAQDTTFVKVHFLYGSKPKREFKSSERKWFGGVLGGHVGLESEVDQVVSFMRAGKVHWFASRKNPLSRYAIHTTQRFYSIFRYNADSVKKAIVYIPISRSQKQKLDSLISSYVANTPYDYAFFGMRCGAATYDLLARLDILKRYSYRKTYRRIFYPRRLRKRIFKKATENSWRVEITNGSRTRKWERDVKF
jgi:hypothetical protein